MYFAPLAARFPRTAPERWDSGSKAMSRSASGDADNNGRIAFAEEHGRATAHPPGDRQRFVVTAPTTRKGRRGS
jgi:hypothetical protein